MNNFTEWVVISFVITFFEFLKYLIFCLGGALFFWILLKKWTLPRSWQQVSYSSEQSKKEIAYSFLSCLIIGMIVALPFHSSIATYSSVYRDWQTYGWVWGVSSFFFLVIFHDAYFYWVHRAFHQVSFLRRFHEVHHSSKKPSFLTTFSFHPVEAFFLNLWLIPVLLYIPLHINVVRLFGIVVLFWNMEGHAGFKIWGEKRPFLFKWLNPPQHHDLHHERGDLNYGLFLSFWDQAMKTKMIIEKQKEIKSKNN